MSMKRLIICDDDREFADSLARDFVQQNWLLDVTENLHELEGNLKKNSKEYFAVILDIKGLINADQEVEDSSFITQAITFLDRYYSELPRVVLSGEEKDFGEIRRFYRNEKVLQKIPEGIEELEVLLKEYDGGSEIHKIRSTQPSLYEIFELGYLDKAHRSKVDQIVGHSSTFSPIKSEELYVKCRELMEDVFTALNAKSEAYIPNEFFNGDEVNHTYCIRYLNGQDVKLYRSPNTVFQDKQRIPSHIFSALNTIRSNAGKALHTGKVKPTTYTEMATIYATFDLLNWFKEFMDSKDPFNEEYR